MLEDVQRSIDYADYDVDGTMSCVSWIWFLQSIGFNNYIYSGGNSRFIESKFDENNLKTDCKNNEIPLISS